MRYIRIFLIMMTVSCVLGFHSCNTCSRPQKLDNIIIDIDLSEFNEESIYLDLGNRVLYALPTPIEASMLIKNWGVPYTSLLNDPANASSYLTKSKQTVNLGIYITDMTTAGIYEQSQTVLRYRQAIMQLIEALGLKSVADQNKMQEIEDNINNKNELLRLISDIYAACTEFLSEDERGFYVLAMLSGGWVEGMYIATSLLDENEAANADKMKNIVADNRLTFDLLWGALGSLDEIPEDALYLMTNMSYLAHLFGHQTLLSLPPRDEQAGNVENVTPQFFTELKEHITLLRNQFVRI